jgi:hypothetical protein
MNDSIEYRYVNPDPGRFSTTAPFGPSAAGRRVDADRDDIGPSFPVVVVVATTLSLSFYRSP